MKGKKPIILLAEDEQNQLMIFERRLKREGFDVIPARHAQEIIEHGLNVDALVVDVRIPAHSKDKSRILPKGIEAVATLISEKNLSKEIPIIFISIWDETEQPAQKALKNYQILEGRYHWLQKPFELDFLVHVIKENLKKQAQEKLTYEKI